MKTQHLLVPPDSDDFSPIENEPPLRWFRRVKLAPPQELGIVRRALFLAALTWLPIAVWALVDGRWRNPASGESLIHHFGVHVRCLLAVPLFILAEGAVHATCRRITTEFVTGGLVAPAQLPAFRQALADARRLRDSSLPWVLLAGLIVAWRLLMPPTAMADTFSWAQAGDGRLGFGGLWYGYVAQPVFVALLLAWLWRIALMTQLCWRLGRLDLSLVPVHPDRLGGLGIIEMLPKSLALVALGLSAVIASGWAHQITIHKVAEQNFIMPAIAFVVLWTLLAMMPLLAFIPALFKLRMRAVPQYAALVGTHGRLVDRRWIAGKPVSDSALLDAPEIGSVADTAGIYAAVMSIRVIPIGKATIAAVLLPFVLPILSLILLEVPFKNLMLELLHAIV